MYRYNSLSSKSDVLLKSVIPVVPAYFIHNYPSGMCILFTIVVTAFVFSLNILKTVGNLISVITICA